MSEALNKPATCPFDEDPNRELHLKEGFCLSLWELAIGSARMESFHEQVSST